MILLRVVTHGINAANPAKPAQETLRRLDADHPSERALALGCECDDARIHHVPRPAQREAPLHQRRAQRAGQMVPALTPVETGAAQDTARTRVRRYSVGIEPLRAQL